MKKNELNCEQQYEYDKVNEWGRNQNLEYRARSLKLKYIRKYSKPTAEEIVGDLE